MKKVWLTSRSESYVDVILSTGGHLMDFREVLSPALDAALLLSGTKARLKVVQRPFSNAMYHYSAEKDQNVFDPGALFLAVPTPSGEELHMMFNSALTRSGSNYMDEAELAVHVSRFLSWVARNRATGFKGDPQAATFKVNPDTGEYSPQRFEFRHGGVATVTVKK